MSKIFPLLLPLKDKTGKHLHPSCVFFSTAEEGVTKNNIQAIPEKVNLALPLDPPLLEGLENIPEHLINAVDDLTYHLDKSVKLRTEDIPHHQCVSTPYV